MVGNGRQKVVQGVVAETDRGGGSGQQAEHGLDGAVPIVFLGRAASERDRVQDLLNRGDGVVSVVVAMGGQGTDLVDDQDAGSGQPPLQQPGGRNSAQTAAQSHPPTHKAGCGFLGGKTSPLLF